MNPDRLLPHFETISEADDLVPRLRQYIFDLAVRGKLVEQDPVHEPAAALLKRIEKEKAKLVKDGKIRSPRELGIVEPHGKLFSVPSGWVWCRLSEIGAIIGGGTPPSSDSMNFAPGGSGIAWLTPADLGRRSGLYVSHGARDLTSKGLQSSSATVMPKGSVLFTSRAPIGYTAIAANEVSTNQGFKSIVPYIMECNLYISVYFRAFAKWIDAKAPGTTFREISGRAVSNLPFPLPPLAEQHRIVAKVDELMVLCDDLEAARIKLETRRDRLVAATLHHLNNGATSLKTGNSSDFKETVRFYFNHLPRLTTRPEHIKQLRQTVLSLALEGRLVPQDPSDEPATQLLERVAKRRETLIAQRAIKPISIAADPNDDEVDFNVPLTWHWTRLGAAFDVRDGTHDTPKYIRDGYPLITSKNLSTGALSFETAKLISEADHRQICERSRVDRGDILFAMIGSIGNPVIVDTDREFSIKNVALFKYFDKAYAEPRYLLYFLTVASKAMRAKAAGGVQSFVSLGFLRNYPFPLPPLAEQRRIVAKVDELMTWCDEVEAQLTTTATTRRQLLEATLRGTLRSSFDHQDDVVQQGSCHSGREHIEYPESLLQR